MKCDTCRNGHAVICGLGHLGGRIAEQMTARGCKVTVIEKDVTDSVRRRAEAGGWRVIEGDIRDDSTLEEAEIGSAGCVMAVTGDDQANLEAAMDARRMNDGAAVVVRLFDQGLARRVERVLGIHALSTSFLASPAYVSAATDDSIAALFSLDNCYLSLACGRPLSNQRRSKGLRIVKDNGGLRIADDSDESGDILFATVQKEDRRPFHSRRKRRKAKTLANSIRRLHPVGLLRNLAAVWEHATVISRTILLALVAVGLFSVLMFSTIGRMNPLDAFYFVVTTMTTTGYGDINLQNAPAGLKVYGILMMISGAALMATIYAIIADYVLTARVEHLLGRREVNLRDHTVVVGLGNVGYRVAHALKTLGTEVVAIEANPNADNLHAARMMFPVVVGDASKSSILQKTGIERAAAVLALTDDSMLNLSVALHAREYNPTIKTVIRTYELDLEEKFKQFGLDEVLSTSAIAAPAFIDAALYPGVLGSFRCGDEDILIARHTVDAGSPLLDKSVKEIGEEIGIAVVLAATGPHNPHELTSSRTIIRSGQRVIVLLEREKVGVLVPNN